MNSAIRSMRGVRCDGAGLVDHRAMLRRVVAVGVLSLAALSFSSTTLARDVCNCKGYAGPGGPCYTGPGGGAYAGPGGPAYSGPGGPCYAGPSGPRYGGPGGKAYAGPGGPRYDGPGGPAYDGPSGPAYSGPGGPCYAGPGGPCYSGPGGTGDDCPSVCKCRRRGGQHPEGTACWNGAG